MTTMLALNTGIPTLVELTVRGLPRSEASLAAFNELCATRPLQRAQDAAGAAPEPPEAG